MVNAGWGAASLFLRNGGTLLVAEVLRGLQAQVRRTNGAGCVCRKNNPGDGTTKQNGQCEGRDGFPVIWRNGAEVTTEPLWGRKYNGAIQHTEKGSAEVVHGGTVVLELDPDCIVSARLGMIQACMLSGLSHVLIESNESRAVNGRPPHKRTES
jgi:hypothetical protein